MKVRAAIVLLGTAALPLSVSAQVRGMSSVAVQPGFSQGALPVRGISSVTPRHGFAHPFNNRRILLGSPYFYSDYGPDYGPEPAQPEIVIVPAAAPAPPAPEPAKAQPLMIELQGNQYVRVSAEESTRNGPHDDLHKAPSTALAMLIFRDGRKEEVGGYTIVGNTMYASANFWASGSWNRKILISELDLPATLQANQDRGVRFILPAGPNEVVTRP